MEILSPASNLEHIKVAIDGGANAVYGGLKKWNARNKAINFSDAEYNFLIDELHNNGIKFFLTLNILMLDEEIDEVIEFLKNNRLPDAFIVADIGLSQRLKKEFPNVALHFSTQFGCHNVDDVNYVESIGGERAILARELTLEELNKIKENTNIELESFIWGSQCLSFSGLCFFGTLINGGGGNRGKCIITCRDIYTVNNEDGNYLYVHDMDCINLISKMKGIDCLKLEGRRRNPQEIMSVLEQIKNNVTSKVNTGYLYGNSVSKNGLYEKINSRVKPVMKASLLSNINHNDVCVEYRDGIPFRFSVDYLNPNVYYMYTEYKKDYSLLKKNLSLDVVFDNDVVKNILYVNNKGEGHTFISDCDSDDLILFDPEKIIDIIESLNTDINIYKIKFQKNGSKDYYISKKMLEEVICYLVTDCKSENMKRKDRSLEFENIYLETQKSEVIDEFINDSFVKIIYDIATIDNLKNIKSVIDKYGDSIIYKLPMFNWKGADIRPYLKLLENNEVMFTRMTQLYLCEGLNFKKKYADYTIYIWNKDSLSYLLENGVTEFTASPELSYAQNCNIFDSENMQVILAGKLPLVYSRNCFGHIFGCNNCSQSRETLKGLKNRDKNLDFEIFCNSDIRYVVNKHPILNNYSNIELKSNTSFRYVTLTQDVEEIKETVKVLKKENYYDSLMKQSAWLHSYECNVVEGRE